MKYVLEESIAAPAHEVFQVFTDLTHAPERISAIQSLEVLGKGPVGKGTRFRETRVMFGKESTEEMEITEFDPPRAYSVEGLSCGCEFHTRYTFEGGQRETAVTMTMTTKPLTLVAKLLTPVMGLIFGGAMKKALRADHAELKAYTEAATDAPA